MTREAVAFAPGHVTGFFEICRDAEDAARIGSRGAGFSVGLGVTSRVRIGREGFPGITCRLDGRPFDAFTTRAAVELLVTDKQWCVEIDQHMDLPVSQGFGMSAAGALSACVAAAHLLGRPHDDAVWAAHTAEVLEGTGLGDVVGAARGGLEVRMEAGLPPHGRLESFGPSGPRLPVTLAVVDQKIETRGVLRDPARAALIRSAGVRAQAAFASGRTLDRFAEVSRGFAREARLATPKVQAAWEAARLAGPAAQCMLGGSVFVFAEPAQATSALSPLGPVWSTHVEPQGARLMPGDGAARQG